MCHMAGGRSSMLWPTLALLLPGTSDNASAEQAGRNLSVGPLPPERHPLSGVSRPGGHAKKPINQERL